VNSTTRKGILPQILDEILAARKQAKRDMKNATDPMEKAVQNGRQLALKVCVCLALAMLRIGTVASNYDDENIYKIFYRVQ